MTVRIRPLLLALLGVLSLACAETFELTLEPGWNLVSVSIAPDDPAPEAVFQGVDARIVWRYDAEVGMYAVAERIEPGRGYWVYVGSTEGRGGRSTATVNGTSVRAATLPLRQGWHLVGPVGFAPYAAPTGRDELVDAANLAATVAGATLALLDDLLPGETYRVTVVAEDEAGNRNHFNRTELTVPVLAEPLDLAIQPK